jgi:hypothetical protein
MSELPRRVRIVSDGFTNLGTRVFALGEEGETPVEFAVTKAEVVFDAKVGYSTATLYCVACTADIVADTEWVCGLDRVLPLRVLTRAMWRALWRKVRGWLTSSSR